MSITKVWGHRGASAYAPENTIEAFRLALEMGADGLELDIHMSADGKLIVSHDANTKRCTGFDGEISKMTLYEIKSLDASNRFADKYPLARIPELFEVFNLLKKYPGTELNIEMKDSDTAFLKETAKQCAESGLLSRLEFSSFNHPSLLELRSYLPEARIATLYSKADDAIGYGKANSLFALHPNEAWAWENDNISAAHMAGLRVHPWTVNAPDHIELFYKLGADAVITNFPDVALKIRKSVQLA